MSRSLVKILIVDDNPKNLQILGNILHEENYEVEFAINGETALEWIEKTDFDLILLDIMMPELDGFEVCERMKNNPEKREIPIIFLTAKTDTDSLVKGFETGCVDYITKPFNRKELLARVSTQITIKKQRDEIAKYLEELKVKNKLITHSIKYAQNIQNVILHASRKKIDNLQEYFIFFEPKDIVSGDFYWFQKTNDQIIAAVVDCTGHGVPGAFMSMLGVTFLNETVRHERIFVPNKILNRLREKIIEALDQTGAMYEVHDGMDAAIISLNTRINKLQFSGANNPLCLIRNNEIYEYKGDKMPVAYYERMTDFTNHEISLKKGDMIYLFSDGFADQFGGKNNKKFQSNSLKQLLLDIHLKTLKEQHNSLCKTFQNWKGDFDQIDDVTIIGIRI
jgi:DNA-binding response OmpR family regulator